MLYTRWAQFGLMSTLARVHGVTSRLPWDFGSDALRVFREYAQLRYRLLPYLYTHAVEASETGLPLMRSMYLEFPHDRVAQHVDLQYMLGPTLLIAPMYDESNQRSVYLPSGDWHDYWTNRSYQGGSFIDVEAPLDQMPIFARTNSILPTTECASPIVEAPFGVVRFNAYLQTRGSVVLRDTDGATTCETERHGKHLTIRLTGAKPSATVRLVPIEGIDPPDVVSVNGVELPQEASGSTYKAGGGSAWNVERDGSTHVRLEARLSDG
jgi:alpha-D-xyloside xylohydrolase